MFSLSPRICLSSPFITRFSWRCGRRGRGRHWGRARAPHVWNIPHGASPPPHPMGPTVPDEQSVIIGYNTEYQGC
jgi:hypothetical protein